MQFQGGRRNRDLNYNDDRNPNYNRNHDQTHILVKTRHVERTSNRGNRLLCISTSADSPSNWDSEITARILTRIYPFFPRSSRCRPSCDLRTRNPPGRFTPRMICQASQSGRSSNEWVGFCLRGLRTETTQSGPHAHTSRENTERRRYGAISSHASASTVSVDI